MAATLKHVIIDRNALVLLAKNTAAVTRLPALARLLASMGGGGCLSCGAKKTAETEAQIREADRHARQEIINASPDVKKLVLAVLGAESANILAPNAVGKSTWVKLT